MTNIVTHRFVNPLPDSPSWTGVKNSFWNEAHLFSGANTGALLFRDAAEADGANWLLAADYGKILTAQGSGQKPFYSSSAALTSLTLVQPLEVPYGGTGITGYTVGDLLYASTPSALGKRLATEDGYVFKAAGSGTAPIYGKVRLSGSPNDITGVLTVPSGGTGREILAAYGVLYGSGTSPIGVTATALADSALAGSGGTPFFTQDLRLRTAVTTREHRAIGSGGSPFILVSNDAADRVVLAASGQNIQWGTPMAGVGSGATATFGGVAGSGQTGPASATQVGWVRLVNSLGIMTWVPAYQ